MARLYDRIVAGSLSAPSYWPRGAAKEVERNVPRQIGDIPVVVVDNVMRYYMEGSPQDVWEIESDFPNIAPPFEDFWIEALPHGVINKNGVLVREKVGPSHIGFHVHSERRQDGGWNVAFEMFMGTDNRARGPVAFVPLLVDAAGVGHPDRTVNKNLAGDAIDDPVGVGLFFALRLTPGARAGVVQGVIDMLKPTLLAISFMHCKNVEVRTVEPPRLSPHLKRKGVKPKVRYHVLDIDPMKKTLKTEGRSDEVGLKRALHICRGHFATYTEDAPLFGKYVGTFWKPQHIRGSAKHGAVVKDYNVKAP